jgi:DNA-binding transcriptional ArsR family regulator
MFTLRLEIADLADVRFAYSPLQEVVQSLWEWRTPTALPSHERWREAGQHHLDALDWPLLQAMVSPRGWLPDFLTPRPEKPSPAITDELALLRAADSDRVRADILAAYIDRDGRPTPLPPQLDELRDPQRILRDVADALETYWTLVVEPSWPRMRAVLDADIAYRCHRLAVGGAAALFADLDDRVQWEDGELRLDVEHTISELDVAGRGLPLTPSTFAAHANVFIDGELPPAICYPARGRANWWPTELPAGAASLAALIGRNRARLLLHLADPATTTQLAARCDLTPGAVSQHLSVLYDAALVSRARRGRAVVYQRSTLGDQVAATADRG